MGVVAEGGSPNNDEPHVTPQQGPDLVEDQLVDQGGVPPPFVPAQLVVQTELEDLLEHRTALLHRVCYVLVYPVPKNSALYTPYFT